MRRTAAVGVLAALLGMLAPAPAQAMTAPGSPVPTYTYAARAAAFARAPHVPGASRYDGHLPADVRQVIVVRAASWRSTSGTVLLYQRSGSGWKRLASWYARLGYGGLVVGTKRVQGTGTTPAGAYRITESFGRLADPGARLPYTKVTNDHWWVEDRRSAYYNQLRLGSLGGFALRTTGYNLSEHLMSMGSQYDYAAVVDYNRPNPVIGRGAGIFLHAYGHGLTGGCIAVSHDRARAVVRWLDPAKHPRILIGPSAWLDA